MDKKESMLSAVISVILGLLLILLKGEVISIALTVLSAAILISAVVDFLKKKQESAVVKAVIGVCILVFGWMLVNMALYILAAGIIIMGLLQIVSFNKWCPVNLTAKEKVFYNIKPLLTVLAGACLFFNQGGTVDWMFMVTGALLVAEGVLELFSVFR